MGASQGVEHTAMSLRQLLAAKLDETFRGGAAEKPMVLDIGCGDGIATGVLVDTLAGRFDAAFRIISLDLRQVMVEAAQARLRGTSWARNVHGVMGDFYRMPFGQESFDYVIGLNVFHGCRRTQLISETRRVLKPGGVFLAYDRAPQLLPFERMALSLTRAQLTMLLAARRAGRVFTGTRTEASVSD